MISPNIKNKYIECFGIAVIVLALGRCAYDGIIDETAGKKVASAEATTTDTWCDLVLCEPESTEIPHKIRSVPNYKVAFPDSNSVQMVAAQRWGVKPVRDRADAEQRKSELVYIGASPYYHVDPLHQSIPYMVPRAAVLLEDIGRSFFDSLYAKGVPLHRFIVTSVLRTQSDVAKLRRFNGNATENSCHLYGTTLDICYNRYNTVQDPDGPSRRLVRNDTLKWILTEVLRDKREEGRCFIKYEVKQGCFHLTVR